jgi:hypothetical protein
VLIVNTKEDRLPSDHLSGELGVTISTKISTISTKYQQNINKYQRNINNIATNIINTTTMQQQQYQQRYNAATIN